MIINFCTNPTAAPHVGYDTVATSVIALWEIQTSPTDDFLLLAVTANGFNSATGQVGYAMGLGRPAAQGVGLAVYQPSLPENALLAAQPIPGVTLYTAWTTRPTPPTNYLRRVTYNTSMFAGNAGSGRYQHLNLVFPNGIRVPPSSSLALFVVGNPTSASPVALDFLLIGED